MWLSVWVGVYPPLLELTWAECIWLFVLVSVCHLCCFSNLFCLVGCISQLCIKQKKKKKQKRTCFRNNKTSKTSNQNHLTLPHSPQSLTTPLSPSAPSIYSHRHTLWGLWFWHSAVPSWPSSSSHCSNKPWLVLSCQSKFASDGVFAISKSCVFQSNIACFAFFLSWKSSISLAICAIDLFWTSFLNLFIMAVTISSLSSVFTLLMSSSLMGSMGFSMDKAK